MEVDVLNAEKVIKDIYYSGEKPSNMYWDKLEKDLKYAYLVIDRRAN